MLIRLFLSTCTKPAQTGQLFSDVVSDSTNYIFYPECHLYPCRSFSLFWLLFHSFVGSAAPSGVEKIDPFICGRGIITQIAEPSDTAETYQRLCCSTMLSLV